jgi:hypothetical protein
MNATRRSFIGKTAAAMAVSYRANSLEGQAGGTLPESYRRLVAVNNQAIPSVIRELDAPQRTRSNIRRTGTHLETLSAAFCAPESTYYRSDALIVPMQKAAQALLAAQHPDGTIDSGNLNSPPDTGFVVETACTALAVLRQVDDPRTASLREVVGRFAVRAGEALVTGGVHTPNHRWVICSALARIHSLFPAAKYVARINDWLGEGIYVDADGQFEERSTGIYSQVTDGAFLTMARLLHRPELLEPVRRNLDMNVYYLHPDGEVETVGSRRQDQLMTSSIAGYYRQYRYLAIGDSNPLYGAIVNLIEGMPAESFPSPNLLIYFLEEPILKKSVPADTGIPSDYAKVFTNSGLARIRRGPVSATIYGGSDWPLGVESGLASNPTFFTLRKGKAVLQSVRMGCQFFSLGVFRSQGLKVNGKDYSLHQRFDAPYYQPLPKAYRNRQGDYALTAAKDERFWSKLDFPRREVSNVQTLEQRITIRENRGAFELDFDISGQDGVPVTIEFAFRPDGDLQGRLQESAREKALLLKEGTGRYRVGDDVIEFGPGQAEHEFLNLSGHSYTAHGASLRASGTCVYITGFAPFQRSVTIRAV